MPVRMTYNPDGDMDKESDLRDYAMAQRFVLRDLMKFNNLKQDQRFINFPDGGSLHIKSCWDQDDIQIYSPRSYSEDKWGLSRAMVASTCRLDNGGLINFAGFTVWDPWNNAKANVGFQIPCSFFYNNDVACWLNSHMSWFKVRNYTVNESKNTITAPDYDFQPSPCYGGDLSIRPGYFAALYGTQKFTRVTSVLSNHTLKLGNVKALFWNGSYQEFDLGYCIRMFTSSGLAMNGCGVSQPQISYSNSDFCSDSHQIQSYVDLWANDLGLQQCRVIHSGGRGFYTPYTQEANREFGSYIDELIEYTRDNSGWSRIGNIPTYMGTGLYRFDKGIDRL